MRAWVGAAAAAIAGLAALAAPTPAAVDAGTRGLAAKCTPGRAVSEVVRLRSSVTVAGRWPPPTKKKRNVWITTGRTGEADVCLRLGQAKCTVARDTRAQILPAGTRNALFRIGRGRVRCLGGGGATIVTAGQRVTFQNPGLWLHARRGAAARSGGIVYSVAVRPGRPTEVQVVRGAAVVSGVAGPRRAVVVAKQQEVLIPRRGNPRQPTALRLSAEDRKVFARLRRDVRLPPEPDRRPPNVTIDGPPDPSSLRSATFTFVADEPGVVFSCALDNLDFRRCTGTQSYARLEPGAHEFRVRAVDPAGNSRTVTYRWTVDASRIVFASERDGNVDIYTIEADGTDERRLTSDPVADEAPEWSPDGTRIAFHRRGPGTDVYVMDAAGTDARRVASSPATDRNPSWSPDGRRLAFESNRDGNLEIHVVDLASGAVRQLTNTAGANFDPAWSPEGSRIAFASTRDGNEEIYVMNADGGDQRRLTVVPGPDFNPAWSPDGSRLAFHSRRGAAQHIWVMQADGTGQEEVTRGPTNDHNPAWSPDGQAIVFQRELPSSTPDPPPLTIYYVLVDGSGETRLLETPGNHYDPDW